MSQCFSAPNLIPVDEAISQLLASVSAIKQTELIELADCNQRVFAEPILSPINVPGFNNSAMDGYALRADELNRVDVDSDVSATRQTQFNMVGKSLAGQPYLGSLANGECIRIMTGSPIPKGANAVVMQENTQLNEQAQNQINLLHPVTLNDNIRLAGEDIAKNQVVFENGHKIRSVDIGVLSSLGIAKVNVFRKIKVAVLSTGNELTQPGLPLAAGHIYDSNRITIQSMLNRLGVDVIDFGIIKDDLISMTEAFKQADQQADVVISSGGVSVGEADYTKQVLATIGQVGFWKVAMKPGKPFAFGRMPNSLFMGLPGNPVSAAVTFHILALPAITKLMGAHYKPPIRFLAQTLAPIRKRPGRMDFQRGIADVSAAGTWQVTPLKGQGSGIMSSLSRANCYIVLPQQGGPVAANEPVTIQLFDAVFHD